MEAMNDEIRGIIREYADENEQARFDAGLLSLADADSIVRDVIFGDVQEWPTAARLHPVAVVELANLRYPKDRVARNAQVSFETAAAEELGRDEFQRLTMLKGIFPAAVKLEPLCVTAKVGKLTHKRYKARIVLAVGDQTFCRDLWLDDDRAPLSLDEMDLEAQGG